MKLYIRTDMHMKSRKINNAKSRLKKIRLMENTCYQTDNEIRSVEERFGGKFSKY